MKRMNKVLSILLVIALLLPTFAFAQENVDSFDNSDLKMEKISSIANQNMSNRTKRTEFNSDIDLEKQREAFNDFDDVRIIVELESEPSIIYATSEGIRYEELSNSKISKIEKNIEAQQNLVKNEINKRSIKMEYINDFKTVFNGFSGNVKFKDISIIESLKAVKRVHIATEYERPIIEPNMGSSHEMIGSQDLWVNEKLKGERMVVAILDTGIDYRHKDMVLSDETTPKLSKEKIEGIGGLLGKFYTNKVPYGYNYYDLNDVVLDLSGPNASMHGMHVAGTVGANGGIKGVAPESQLLAMKVFSNDPVYATTFGDIYIKAIEDAVKLNADVINMSLGSTAAFYTEGNPEGVAITNAANNGIVTSVSAGNSNKFGNGWYDPLKENPDIGVVGSPSLNTDTISVASIENLALTVNAVSYLDGGKTKQIPMMTSGDLEFSERIDGEVEFVESGLGKISDFSGKNLNNKIALIKRGELSFGEKIVNAQQAGAIGVVIYNNQENGNAIAGMAFGNSNVKVPAGMIGYDAGVTLAGLQEKMIRFPKELITTPNANAGKMSDFTSWGTTPSLELKPEITAPGGMIYSTLNDDKYGFMSGTSMAAPHLAGGAALVMQHLKGHETYKDLSLEEQVKLTKLSLMNTAIPVKDGSNTFVSPRRQGSGLMNLPGAVNNQVRLVNASTNEGKVELKEIKDTKFTLKLKIINDSLDDITYMVDTSVLVDNIIEGRIANSKELSSDIKVAGGNEILVMSGESKDLTIDIDFSNSNGVYKNMFIEGFVMLKDKADLKATLVLPYVGFYGNWDEPKILDGITGIDEESYYGASVLVYENEEYLALPQEDGQIYLNPGTVAGDRDGTGGLFPELSFLRNSENVSYNIISEDGDILRTLYKEKFVRKDYYDGRYYPAKTVKNAMWNGEVKGKVVPDGKYFYEIAANVHYPGAKVQSKKIPITIDTTGPEVTDISYNNETGLVSWSAVDEGIGSNAFLIYVNEEYLDDGYVGVIHAEDNKSEYEINIKNYIRDIGENVIEIYAYDKLNNESIAVKKDVTDNENADIYLTSPDLLVPYNEPVVSNPQTIEELPINSIIVEEKAYDQHYAATNTMAQLHIIFNDYLGKPVYVKISKNEAMDLRGNLIDLYELPETVRYYDSNGDITERQTIVENPDEVNGVGIEFVGFVTNFEALDKILIDDVEVDFEYVENIVLGDPADPIYQGPGEMFSTTIHMQDGYKETKITAISKTGAKSNIVRRFWVDNTAPILELEVLEREPDSDKATIKVTMKDNNGFVALYMFDSYEFVYDETFDRLDTNPANETYTIEVELEEGDNTFEFSLYDIADNSAIKEITITRTSE